MLNKVDLVKRDTLLVLADEANKAVPFERTFMISAATGDGTGDLLAFLAERVPPGPWLYPAEEVSDIPLRQFAAEITREKLFDRLHQELPYQATVETDQWTEQKDGSVRIEQTIFVARDSQKKIVIGKGGQAIKAISMAARTEIAEIAERPVHLFLFVKVRENWADDPRALPGDGNRISALVEGPAVRSLSSPSGLRRHAQRGWHSSAVFPAQGLLTVGWVPLREADAMATHSGRP